MPDKQEKHVYDESEIHYTDGFAPDKYRTADKERQKERAKKKKEKGGAYTTLIRLIVDRKISSFAKLCKVVIKEFPEFEEALYEKHHLFRDFIYSQTTCKSADCDLSYDELYDRLHTLLEEHEALEKRCTSQKHEILDLHKQLKEVQEENLELRKYICEVAGDGEPYNIMWETI